MGDWALSKIEFAAPASTLSKLFTKFEKLPQTEKSDSEKYYLFNILFPYPSELTNNTDEQVSSKLREKRETWDSLNLGSKDARICALLDYKITNSALFTMFTKWNPPWAGLVKLSYFPEFQDLKITVYYEIQATFAESFQIETLDGCLIIENGLVTHQSFIDNFLDVNTQEEWLAHHQKRVNFFMTDSS